MTVLLSENWTGADGSAWPTSWQPQEDQTGTATVVGNAGQLVTRASSTGAARQQSASALAAGDYDISVTLTVPAGQPDFSIGVVWRADTTSDGAAQPGSRMFALTGVSMRLDTNGDLYLYRQNGGNLTVLTATPTNIGSLVGTGSRSLRVQQVGTAIRVRAWNSSAPEPSVWTLQVTDTGGSTTSGGRFSLAASAGFGGTSGSTATVQFDNLTIAAAATTASPSPTPSPTPTATPTVGAGLRRNWATMSTADRQVVLDGLQRAKTSGAYDNLTRLHQQAMLGDANEWHKRPILLPAHRWFLTQLEAAMGNVPMPYWDWTSSGFPPGLGGDGNPLQGYRVTSGPFAGWSSVVYNASTNTFTTRNGIVRQLGSGASSLPTATQLASVLRQSVYDSSSWDTSAPTGLRNWLEGWTGNPGPAMHNRVHNYIGGEMGTATSPNDPIFWFHHSNVDRIWAGWQRRYGVTNYAAPAGQRATDPIPLTGGVTPAQMFPMPTYDQLP